MRRSHSETQELVAARISDYVANDMSEPVLAASLKALHLDPDEVKYAVWIANLKKLRALTGSKP
jgi:hypothetical protein